jgi:phage-related protein
VVGYTVKIVERVYVLHCFQKKSAKGIETPKPDMDVIRERLMDAPAWFLRDLQAEWLGWGPQRHPLTH